MYSYIMKDSAGTEWLTIGTNDISNNRIEKCPQEPNIAEMACNNHKQHDHQQNWICNCRKSQVLSLYDALAIIANHFLFPDFSTRELYFFFCIALVIGVDSTPAAIPIIQTYFQFVSSPKRTISAAETSQYRI